MEVAKSVRAKAASLNERIRKPGSDRWDRGLRGWLCNLNPDSIVLIAMRTCQILLETAYGMSSS